MYLRRSSITRATQGDSRRGSGASKFLKNIARPVWHVYRIVIDPVGIVCPGSAVPALAFARQTVCHAATHQYERRPRAGICSDGIAEDVITALSRAIPRCSSLRGTRRLLTRGERVDVRQVGREPGVRHVLEGAQGRQPDPRYCAAHRGGDQHRGPSGYDRDLADVFAVQDEFTEALTTALAPAIADAELRRAMQVAGSLDACCLSARPVASRQSNRRRR